MPLTVKLMERMEVQHHTYRVIKTAKTLPPVELHPRDQQHRQAAQLGQTGSPPSAADS